MPQRVLCVQQESVTFVCISFVFAQIEVCYTHAVGQCEKIRNSFPYLHQSNETI